MFIYNNHSILHAIDGHSSLSLSRALSLVVVFRTRSHYTLAQRTESNYVNTLHI